MQNGLFGFLLQVALFITFVRLYRLQKSFKIALPKPALKSTEEHFYN